MDNTSQISNTSQTVSSVTSGSEGYSVLKVGKQEVRDGNLHKFYRRLYEGLECYAIDSVEVLVNTGNVDVETVAYRLSMIPLVRNETDVFEPFIIDFTGPGTLTSAYIPYTALKYIIVIHLSAGQRIRMKLTPVKGTAAVHAKYDNFIYAPTLDVTCTLEYPTLTYSPDDFKKFY